MFEINESAGPLARPSGRFRSVTTGSNRAHRTGLFLWIVDEADQSGFADHAWSESAPLQPLPRSRLKVRAERGGSDGAAGAPVYDDASPVPAAQCLFGQWSLRRSGWLLGPACAYQQRPHFALKSRILRKLARTKFGHLKARSVLLHHCHPSYANYAALRNVQ
jgi:hypothetical protein